MTPKYLALKMDGKHVAIIELDENGILKKYNCQKGTSLEEISESLFEVLDHEYKKV